MKWLYTGVFCTVFILLIGSVASMAVVTDEQACRTDAAQVHRDVESVQLCGQIHGCAMTYTDVQRILATAQRADRECSAAGIAP